MMRREEHIKGRGATMSKPEVTAGSDMALRAMCRARCSGQGCLKAARA